MPLTLQQWDCILSTNEVLGRTIHLAVLLEAEVRKPEHALALPTYEIRAQR